MIVGWRKKWLSALATLAVASAASLAHAQGDDAAEARSLFEQGVELHEAGDHRGALEHYRRSRALVARASTVLNIAYELSELGEPASAMRVLDELSQLELDPRLGDSPLELYRSLAERVARVELHVPERAEVRLGGTPVDGSGTERTIWIEPGREYEIQVRLDQQVARTFTVRAEAGERVVESVEEAEEAEPAPAPRVIEVGASQGLSDEAAVGGGIAFGVAGVATLITVITGVIALDELARFERELTDEAAESAEAMALVSDVSLAFALTAGAVGLVVFLVDLVSGRPAAEASLRPVRF